MSTDDTLPWTTSRCNRLLRPLSSKLAKLRKELERPRTVSAESRNPSSAFAIKGSPQKTTNFTRPANKPRGFEKARDPDWRPGAKTGPGKKTTYGGRGRGRAPALQRNGSGTGRDNVSRPGEIAFTPLISRMGGQLHSSPQIPISPLRKYSKIKGPLLAPMNPPDTHVPGEIRKLTQGLSEAYANILQSTTTGGEARWKGTRSLMGACLRRLPAYIELEEHFAKLDKLEEDGEEERDIANEIYEHLETVFEQEHGQGWRPFKCVVRAHATTLVCDAVTDEVLGLDNVLVLVTHCLNSSAWDEAERLLLAYAPLLESVSIPINTRADLFDPQKSPYLYSVKSFVHHTGRYRLLYDLLEHMVAFELLPLEWLATDSMRPVWDRLVRTITENDRRTLTSASRFFETVTLASMGLPDARLLEDEVTGSVSRRFVPSSREELRRALDTTFSSLLTVLCSIALVNNNRDDSAGKEIVRRVASALDTVVIALSAREDIRDELKLLGPESDDVQLMAQRAIWVIFASYLVHLGGPENPGKTSLDSSTSIGLVNWVTSQYSSNIANLASIFATIPSLVSSTARGTGRIWRDDGFDQLQRLVTALTSSSGCRLPHKLWTLKRLALESARDFAHGTGDAEHMAYVRNIEKMMHTQGRLVIMQSPQKNESPTVGGGFRWEEGIGEWVTCTPFAKQNVKRQTKEPVRALELLPTPAQSEDEKTEASDIEDGLPNGIPDTPVWEVTALDYDDNQIPQSSPIKKRPRVTTSSLGKRARAPSPKVIISMKRMHITPPGTPPFRYYSELPEEKHVGPRRSRRPKQESHASAARLRTQRSRTSLESGLRNLRRPVYAEPALEVSDSDTEASSASQDDSEDSSVSMKSVRTKTVQTNTRSSERTRTRHSLPTVLAVHDDDDDDTSERDELGRTPARPRLPLRKRTSVRQSLQPRTQWMKSRQSIVADSDDDSQDELSFC
ncbi:hypothetical protein J4E93_002024 [Alternaria ventricosa]|uniref:uncharacterized protein n=1 Tax=Alternaria ventricosa TaxID=1187951 RepID=UPI0020C54D46|nr:uncharacterized protein J4E93_002024 [Alternaria ventricosa]KAI4651828.1 hypothetical protein J4E93_002024 [Alternaria ventricosa]